MEFISAEEFLKQPIEVQKVFLDWWKEEKGDLFVLRKEYEKIKHSAEIRCCNYDLAKMYGIPLFTEGQLRQFIEDKTGCKVAYNIGELGYQLVLYKFQKSKNENEENICDLYETYELFPETDLLKSYWKVALEIAKEKVKA